jgi:glutamyl-tRNA synthetase
LLGLPPVRYAHVPLALNPAGQRLAKRDGAVTLAELAAIGLDADQVVAVIAASMGLAQAGEQVTPAILLDRFDPRSLPTEPWIVDPGELANARSDQS